MNIDLQTWFQNIPGKSERGKGIVVWLNKNRY